MNTSKMRLLRVGLLLLGLVQSALVHAQLQSFDDGTWQVDHNNWQWRSDFSGISMPLKLDAGTWNASTIDLETKPRAEIYKHDLAPENTTGIYVFYVTQKFGHGCFFQTKYDLRGVDPSNPDARWGNISLYCAFIKDKIGNELMDFQLYKSTISTGPKAGTASGTKPYENVAASVQYPITTGQRYIVKIRWVHKRDNTGKYEVFVDKDTNYNAPKIATLVGQTCVGSYGVITKCGSYSGTTLVSRPDVLNNHFIIENLQIIR